MRHGFELDGLLKHKDSFLELLLGPIDNKLLI